MASSNPSCNGHARDSISPVDDKAPVPSAGDNEEVELLRGENAALLARVDELEQLVTVAVQDSDERWAERQREYEALLEEKSEVIRGLHQKMADLREQAAAQLSRPASAASAEKTPDRDELLKAKKELDDRRRQLVEDEESMMSQLRQMEMSLARDRAELARQRAELQRLHNDLKHELEVATRDSGLRERLGALQRRAATTTAPPVRPGPHQDTPPAPKTPATPNGAKSSGIFRRLFGGGQ